MLYHKPFPIADAQTVNTKQNVTVANCMFGVWFGLVCLVLWHINLCRLFNAKSIFM